MRYNWKSAGDWEDLLLLFQKDVAGAATFSSLPPALNMVVIPGASAAVLWPWDGKCEDEGQHTNCGWKKNNNSGSSVTSVEG